MRVFLQIRIQEAKGLLILSTRRGYLISKDSVTKIIERFKGFKTKIFLKS